MSSKIIRIVKNNYKSGCKVYFENGEIIDLNTDLIVKYQFKTDLSISENQLQSILDEQSYIDAAAYSHRLLNIRLRTERELFQKLYQKEYSKEISLKVINKLKEDNFINDKIFAEQYSENLRTIKKYGESRIRLELMKKGVSDDIISEILSNNTGNDDDEYSNAFGLAEKKLKLISKKSKDKKINSLLLFLKNKGFSSEISYKVIKNLLISE